MEKRAGLLVGRSDARRVFENRTRFYVGAHYAQSRYLCYYLQEQGLLRKFYQAFHTIASTDPAGYKTLEKTLGEEDMKGFQQR